MACDVFNNNFKNYLQNCSVTIIACTIASTTRSNAVCATAVRDIELDDL